MTLKVEDSRSYPNSINGVSQAVELESFLSKQYAPFVPLGDRVLLRRVEDEKKSKLDLPDKYRQQSNKGEVVAVGELVLSLKTGDRVLFGEYSAERFDRDGEELWLVRIQFIRGVERLVKE